MKIDTSNSKRIEIQNANKHVTTGRKSNINTNRGSASSKNLRMRRSGCKGAEPVGIS